MSDINTGLRFCRKKILTAREFNNLFQNPDSTLNNPSNLKPVTSIQESDESSTDCVIILDGSLEADFNKLSDGSISPRRRLEETDPLKNHGSIRLPSPIQRDIQVDIAPKIVATIEDQESDMSSPKIKEPSVFYGTPEEDAKDWLARFEEISEVNKWKTSRLPYVKLYLEGTARQWLLVNDFPNWDDFRGKFLNAFKLKNF